MAKRTIAYLARDLNTLNDLKLSCERDEGMMNAILIDLVKAKIHNPATGANGLPATAAIYMRPTPAGGQPGQLTLIQVTTAQTEQAIINQQVGIGKRYLFTGEAIIGTVAIEIVVFKP
jgi:hypothetical protein